MAVYLQPSYERKSAAQNPEKLHRSPALETAVVASVAVTLLLLWVDIPALPEIFKPALPLHDVG